MGVPSCIWPYESPGAVCAPSRRCLVEGTVTTLAGRTSGLVSPEPAKKVEVSLASEPQTHGDAETAYAEHDLPPAGNAVMTWRLTSQSHRGYCRSIDKNQRARGKSAVGDVWALCGIQWPVTVVRWVYTNAYEFTSWSIKWQMIEVHIYAFVLIGLSRIRPIMMPKFVRVSVRRNLMVSPGSHFVFIF